MARKKKKSDSGPREIRNSKAFHNYTVGDRFEAGIKLQGTEIKAIRSGKAQINDAFIRMDREIPILYHAHISEYEFGNLQNHKPTRPRLLLLNKKEIRRMKNEIEAGGYALIPLRMYFKGGLLKVEIALCKGKKLHDKRETLKRKVQMREAEISMSQRRQ